ncbi:hypothetical protein CO033_02140 [Candidatus Nomurabacteria bacterium CG_4_9_14_0_2_um_filter_32_10]|uniref:Uncharacterized protein n=3 Tax=Candidatus Nomuraibacteriota TaxID=1752729 RepID=A0A2H0CGW1_9BACT|nr:MAG: hypothetical protein COW91_01055 [Candidatus Nomurabacteria bacterium CG22_combo_CG10-13_8_21_14_all_32_8]PIZ85813.1 MAG: hypothetical protein COX94_01935 [Candidatus Nomurabacteria bacterium CG_4_10_14_0_2_um_filter_33_9]PJC49311.1 MAG: hypothetical protein CO033_02140 [Candidatus Nomurabacteria bacterium CG_4_9_14_0_2_um_filter_32_10]
MSIYIKKNLLKVVLVVFVLVLPILSFADDTPITIANPLPEVTSINGLIQNILEGVIKIGMPIIALAIIYCGFLFVSAQGKPESIKKAKDALLYTLIGAAILLGSWAIAQLITETVKAL